MLQIAIAALAKVGLSSELHHEADPTRDEPAVDGLRPTAEAEVRAGYAEAVVGDGVVDVLVIAAKSFSEGALTATDVVAAVAGNKQTCLHPARLDKLHSACYASVSVCKLVIS